MISQDDFYPWHCTRDSHAALYTWVWRPYTLPQRFGFARKLYLIKHCQILIKNSKNKFRNVFYIVPKFDKNRRTFYYISFCLEKNLASKMVDFYAFLLHTKRWGKLFDLSFSLCRERSVERSEVDSLVRPFRGDFKGSHYSFKHDLSLCIWPPRSIVQSCVTVPRTLFP